MFELRVVWKQASLFVLIVLLVLELFVCLNAICLVVIQVSHDQSFQIQMLYNILHDLFQRKSINVLFVIFCVFREGFLELINRFFTSFTFIFVKSILFFFESGLLNMKFIFYSRPFDFLAVLNRFKQLAKELNVGGCGRTSTILFKFFNK